MIPLEKDNWRIWIWNSPILCTMLLGSMLCWFQSFFFLFYSFIVINYKHEDNFKSLLSPCSKLLNLEVLWGTSKLSYHVTNEDGFGNSSTFQGLRNVEGALNIYEHYSACHYPQQSIFHTVAASFKNVNHFAYLLKTLQWLLAYIRWIIMC